MTARGERGTASVLAVALLGVLVLVGCALAVVGAVLVAHRTAQAAADLAALAGAAAVATGDPCAVAARTAAANGGRLADCTLVGRDLRVTVAVAGPAWQGIETGDLLAEARAGPG